MSDMVLDIQTLPEMIFSRIAAQKVRIHEENGTFILTPIIEKNKILMFYLACFLMAEYQLKNT